MRKNAHIKCKLFKSYLKMIQIDEQMNVLSAAVAFLIGIFIDIGARKIPELSLNVMFKEDLV
ncbi:hypothetical protein NQ318_004123 [Aromia moschata]|uniref:Uncharacterized protein n=1 Tax=Aromia moschata TaxID=1265417 RepID=A0AAV8X8Q7_9CUCU|nr:hypothetical protein NQ318_004123 [Aromia moschata]